MAMALDTISLNSWKMFFMVRLFLICHAHYKTFMMFEGGRCAMSFCFI